MANEYSSESAQRELSIEYQHDTVSKILVSLCLAESSHSIGRVNWPFPEVVSLIYPEQISALV